MFDLLERLAYYIGCAVILLFLYAMLVLYLALKNSSDLTTAVTPKLPQDAFKNQTAWITGSSSGIGKEMALILAGRGANLILSARRKAALEEVANLCRARNPKCQVKVLVLDLNNRESLPGKAEEALSMFDKIDLLVNNGGVSTRVMAREAPIDVDEYLAQVDYLAHVALVKKVLPTMENNPDARIINTLSVASKIGVPVRTAYCGAKHALYGFMNALRIECILRGHEQIHILNLILGSTNTDLPTRAVVGATNGQVDTIGSAAKDTNLVNGLDVVFVAERTLAVSFRRSISECWLAKGKELLILYLNQYVPRTAYKLMTKSVAKQYAVEKSKLA